MNDIFRPHLWKFVLVFFDDILVYSKGVREHLSHFREILQLLQENDMIINKKKSTYLDVEKLSIWGM